MQIEKHNQFWIALAAKLQRYCQHAYFDMRDILFTKNESAYNQQINIINGNIATDIITDFCLPGIIPLHWGRQYFSDSSFVGELGHGWHHLYDMRIYDNGSDYLIIRLADGRATGSLKPTAQKISYIPQERLHIGIEDQQYFLQDYQGLRYYFQPFQHHPLRQNNNHIKTLRLVRMENAHGHSIEFHRNNTGDLLKIIDTHNRQLTIHNDSYGRILRIDFLTGNPDEPIDILVEYSYDNKEQSSIGDLTIVLDAARTSHYYIYKNHLLLQETNREGARRLFEWDDIHKGTKARVVKTWCEGYENLHKTGVENNARLHYRAFTYDDAQRVTTVINGRESSFVYHWHTHLPLVDHIVDPMGYRVSFKYDGFHNEIEFHNELHHKIVKEYDDENRLVKIIDTEGRVVEYIYPKIQSDGYIYSDIIQIIDGDLKHYFAYDAYGNMITHRRSKNYLLHYEYNNHGLLSRIYDKQGDLARYVYDDNHELIKEYDAAGNYTHYEYEARGMVASITKQYLGSTNIVYDMLDNIAEIHIYDGNKQQFFYSNENKLEKFIDAHNNVTEFIYNKLNMPMKRINPDGSIIRYCYDSELNITAITGENNKSCEMIYDAKERLVMSTNFDGACQRYQYRPNNQLLRYQNSNGDWHLYQRDNMGRPTTIQYNDGSKAEFTYNLQGQLLCATNNDHAVEFYYNDAGQLIKEKQDDMLLEYRYNMRGMLKHIIVQSNKTLKYDNNNDTSELEAVLMYMNGLETIQPTEQGLSSNPINYHNYDSYGRLQSFDAYSHCAKQRRYNNLNVIFHGNISEIFAFDPTFSISSPSSNRVENISQPKEGALDGEYIYNCQNQLIKVISSIEGVKQEEINFTYDALGRKKSKYNKSFTLKGEPISYKQRYLWCKEQLFAETIVGVNEQPNWKKINHLLEAN